VERADAGADIGAAGDHRLLGLARPLRVENLQLDAVLLEEAGVLPKLGERVLPRARESCGDAQLVLRESIAIESDETCKRRERESSIQSGHSTTSTQHRS